MSEIYAVALTVSQGAGRISATAALLHSEEGRKTNIAMEWKLPHPINAGGNPGEWLYAVLSRITQDYDLHQVTRAEIDGLGDMTEGINE